MADSYRLQVLKALTDHLKGITPANGFTYDLSQKVFRGRAVFGSSDPVPMLSLLEASRPDVGQYAAENSTMRAETLTLLLQGWDTDDFENPTDPLYALMDACEKRLAEIVKVRQDGSGRPMNKEAYMLGGLITALTFGPGVVRPASEGVSSKAFFYLPVRLGLAGDVG